MSRSMSREDAGRIGGYKTAEILKNQKRERIKVYIKNPVLCVVCGIALDYKKRHNKFCSKSCAGKQNGKLFPKRIKTWNRKCLNCDKQVKNPDHAHCSNECRTHFRENVSFEDLGLNSKKKKVFEEQEQSCNMCHNKIWNKKPIALELDHIDGDRKNNKRENLRGLCSNCHAQTDTYKGKNVRNRFTDEAIIKALHENTSAYGAMMSLGMSPQRNVYQRIRKIVHTHSLELPYAV